MHPEFKLELPAILGFDGNYRYLSNFHPCTITYEGLRYRSVEHAYQASKTLDPAIRLKFAQLETAGAAKREGKKLELRPDWEQVKLKVMDDLLRIKFSDIFLQGKLAQITGQIVELNTWDDTFWGVVSIGGFYYGHNHLGRLLMAIRDEARQTWNAYQEGTEYRHYKGGLYTIVCLAIHTETHERMVVYKNEAGNYWTRPESMFRESVVVDGVEVPRFKRL